MSYQVIFNDSLYHHGILGQKWGIRRFRNKDGSLTSAGKKRYGEGEPKQKTKKKSYHRVTLEQRYMDAGMSKEDAEREADKKIKIEKGMAIAAGAAAVTVASVIAYKKIGREYKDKVVKKGDKVYTLSKDADRVANVAGQHQDHFYAANKKDRGKYRSLFGRGSPTIENHKIKPNNKFDIETSMLEDIKVASPNKARKVFIDEFKKDPRYAEYLKKNFEGAEGFRRNSDISKAKKVVTKMRKGQKISDKEIGRLYNAYNVLLVDNSGKDIHKSFLSALKSKGYGGVIDLNDLKYSGFNAKQPMIIFDKSKLNITPPKNISRLDYKDIKEAQETELGKEIIKLFAGTAAGSAVGAGVKYYNNYDDEIIDQYKNKGGKE